MKRTALALAATLMATTASAQKAFDAPAGPPPAAPSPSPATLALARQVAEGDDFWGLVSQLVGAEVKGIEASLGPLTPAEKAKVDAIAKAKLDYARGRVMDRIAPIYAATMSAADLKATAAFLATPAGHAYGGRLIAILPALGESLKGFDLKREILADACAQIAKGCPAKPAPPAAKAPTSPPPP